MISQIFEMKKEKKIYVFPIIITTQKVLSRCSRVSVLGLYMEPNLLLWKFTRKFYRLNCEFGKVWNIWNKLTVMKIVKAKSGEILRHSTANTLPI